MPNYYPLPKSEPWQAEALSYLERRAKRAEAEAEAQLRRRWNASLKPYLRPQRGASSAARSYISAQIERNIQLIAILTER